MDLHKDKSMEIVQKVKESIVTGSGYFGDSVFDSIMPQLLGSGYSTQYTVAQTKPDFSCLDKINQNTKNSPQMCSAKKHILDFYLKESYVQDIFVYNSKNNQVQKRLKMSDKPSVMIGDFKTVSHIHYIKIPALNEMPSNDFDSIFDMVFTLNPTVYAEKMIWMVQN